MGRSAASIEAAAEVVMDGLDKAFLAGRLTQAQYDDECRKLDRRTQRQHARAATMRERDSWRRGIGADFFVGGR